jgi:hypothetical protein
LGLVHMTPLLFRKSALITLLTQAGIMVAIGTMLIGCDVFFSTEWCHEGGAAWLYHLALAAIYGTTILYMARRSMRKETWHSGIAFGLVPAILYFLVFPAIEESHVLLTEGIFAYLEKFFLILVLYIIPLLMLGWLVFHMLQEKNFKDWRKTFAA